MSPLSSSVVMWVSLAVLVFWALGAYNRLVRLRAELVRSLQAVTAQWDSTAQTLRSTLQAYAAEPASESQWGSLGVYEENIPWRSLSLAAKQLQACLTGLISKPHTQATVDDLASLGAAREVLNNAWERLQDRHEDLAGAAVPQQLMVLWQQHAMQSDEKLLAYNTQARAYNQAIAQFPALLVAWIFGFNSTVSL